MHRYYRFGHPKLKPPKDPQTEEEYIAAMEKQEAADAVDREKVEAEEHTRALMAMEADDTPRKSMRLLASRLNGESSSHSGKGYSFRKRDEKDYNDAKAFGKLMKKTKTGKTPKSPATPKTPKTPQVAKTPKTPKTMKTPGTVRTPSTPTPSSICGVKLVLKPGKEAVIEKVTDSKKLSFPKLVEFSIGRTGEVFAIPLNYLRLESGFFKNQEHNTTEQNVPMDFPEFEPKIFKLFTTWVYYNTFREGVKQEDCTLEYIELVKLYQIAEKFQIIVLKNITLDSIVNLFKKYHGWVQFSLADEVYKGTVPGSPLRRLWVEFRIRGEGVEQGVPQLNSEFLTDVVERQKTMLRDAGRGVGLQPLEASDFYEIENGTGRTKKRVPFF